MKFERAVLIAFLGNYLANNVVAAIAAFVPSGTVAGLLSWQYITFVVLAAILVAIMTWWYCKAVPSATYLSGLLFGILGFVISIATAFVTGVTGVLVQTASFSTLLGVLPNFGTFLVSWSTLYLFGYWVIPAVLVSWLMGRGMKTMGSVSHMPQSMGSGTMGSMSAPQRPM